MNTRQALADQGLSQTGVGLVNFVAGTGTGARPLYPEHKNWSPRLGLAYSPKAESGLAKFLFGGAGRSEEHTSELQSPCNFVCPLLLEKKKRSRHASARQSSPLEQPRDRHGPIVRGVRASQKPPPHSVILFFFNDTATTEIYTLSLHDALPI